MVSNIMSMANLRIIFKDGTIFIHYLQSAYTYKEYYIDSKTILKIVLKKY